jgi:hypothetical protein
MQCGCDVWSCGWYIFFLRASFLWLWMSNCEMYG